MAQEAITEINMDVFSRRVYPYYSWLESRIESGWQQTGNIDVDMLKEVKSLAQAMRARFILGVSPTDFKEEVRRTITLFEQASEAFSEYDDEIDTKLNHFCKGISEELGPQFLPEKHQPQVKTSSTSNPAEPIVSIQDSKKTIKQLIKKKIMKMKKKSAKEHVQKKISPPKKTILQPESQIKQKEAEPAKETKKQETQKKKKSTLPRWLRYFIYGDN